MYTGLVADYGEVQTITHADEGVTVRVQTELANELALGDSVAVNGVCLTTTALADQSFEADVMNETLHRSTLGGLAAGDHVNLELSMRADGRLDGHFVQGHIDGVGEVSEVRTDGFARVVTIRGLCSRDALHRREGVGGRRWRQPDRGAQHAREL